MVLDHPGALACFFRLPETLLRELTPPLSSHHNSQSASIKKRLTTQQSKIKADIVHELKSSEQLARSFV
jgi:hypothetical protein